MMPGGLDVQARILSPIGEALYHWLHLGRYLRLQSLDILLDQEVGYPSALTYLPLGCLNERVHFSATQIYLWRETPVATNQRSQ